MTELAFTPEMEAARARAQGWFDKGCNCAESVLHAFLDRDDVPLPPETVALATGLGGGMGATHNDCGAVTGSVVALGCLFGRKNPLAIADYAESHAKMQQELYPIFAGLVRGVEREYGTVVCEKLTDGRQGPQRRARCREIVGFCAALCEKQAAEHKK